MLGSGINQHRFERRKEITHRIGRALRSLSVGTKFGAQLFQESRRARDFGSAELKPLKLGQQIAARERRQSLQIFLEPVDLYHCNMIWPINEKFTQSTSRQASRMRNK